ncbi:MAG: hemerythrin domain-containing protein [Elusimicrobia bacterium]|nr:hemerythrin domain-containing protein [Elusimicrobiota bacterium]
MDILEFLIEDHVFFKDRLNQLHVLAFTQDFAPNRAVALDLVKDIRKRQKDHLRREVELLFPAMKEALASLKISPIDPSVIHHLQEEHTGIGRNLYLLQQELETLPIGQSWLKSLQRVEEPLLAHIDMEDNRIFPQAVKVISKDILERLSRSIDIFTN